jgi:hypothetical protein
MANQRLPDIAQIAIPTQNTLTYGVESNQSYKMPLSILATALINNNSLLTSTLTAALMTPANAEIILAGLNNATTSVLSPDRVDLSSFYFDVDGGTFYDTYVNTSTFDGGTF